ncbi:hypothetical protein TR2A62_0239 [Thalassobium sp. R2A62]|nr:hypothetical protein TR2A62_0239 [Thalassobium sp. R2A62]
MEKSIDNSTQPSEEIAETALADTQKALFETRAALLSAEARLAEQDKILALFNSSNLSQRR